MERCGVRVSGRGSKLQNAPRDAQVRVGRNDIDVIGLDPLIVRDLAHRQRRGACQELRERAFVLRIEMLHQHEPHARIERQMREQLRERLEPARRGADADDRKRRAFARLAALSHGVVCSVAEPSEPCGHSIRASAGNRGDATDTAPPA